jgi:hypothetical protein|tara:strand:+ start:502 stop:735 length:234 start_codon:yes stop_codon:yes gene_type:complete
MREEILEYLDSALFADGFDDAILGFTDAGVVVYDEGRCLEILMLNGLEYDEAYEFYTFNVAGAYVGPKTPIFITCVR